MKLFRDGNQDFWIQILHTIFGVGGLVGPFLVAIFGSKSYFILGITLAIVSFFYFFLQPPDDRESHRVSEIAKPISRVPEIIICILYLLYIGQ